MGTLNPYVKINKYPLGRWASIKNWFQWKLRMSKMPWGKLYRHFWRKRLMKSIIEISNIIEQKTHRLQVMPVPLDMDNFSFHAPYLGTYNGIPVMENPRRLFMMKYGESTE